MKVIWCIALIATLIVITDALGRGKKLGYRRPSKGIGRSARRGRSAPLIEREEFGSASGSGSGAYYDPDSYSGSGSGSYSEEGSAGVCVWENENATLADVLSYLNVTELAEAAEPIEGWFTACGYLDSCQAGGWWCSSVLEGIKDAGACEGATDANSCAAELECSCTPWLEGLIMEAEEEKKKEENKIKAFAKKLVALNKSKMEMKVKKMRARKRLMKLLNLEQ